MTCSGVYRTEIRIFVKYRSKEQFLFIFWSDIVRHRDNRVTSHNAIKLSQQKNNPLKVPFDRTGDKAKKRDWLIAAIYLTYSCEYLPFDK